MESRLIVGKAEDVLPTLATNSVDLAFTSPPFTDARTYGIEADRDSAAWAEWMRPIVRELCRVSKGLVFLNVSDRVQDHRYGNGPEWLHADLTRLDGLDAVRPYAWVKSGPGFDDACNGQPGSGAKHFHRNDWEPIYGYAEPGKLPPHWSDNKAFGSPPKLVTNDGKIKHTRRMPNGETVLQAYSPPDVVNHGNVIRLRIGSWGEGHSFASHGEAPMPLGLPERFICWFCPPGGIVLDSFVGTGTTPNAAMKHGRNFIGIDTRPCQIDLSKRRLRTVTPDMFARS